MSELLFECYHIPKVAYGVDALFSLLNNHPNPGENIYGKCSISKTCTFVSVPKQLLV